MLCEFESNFAKTKQQKKYFFLLVFKCSQTRVKTSAKFLLKYYLITLKITRIEPATAKMMIGAYIKMRARSMCWGTARDRLQGRLYSSSGGIVPGKSTGVRLCGSIMSSKPVVFETPVDNDRFSFITIYRVVYEISNKQKKLW